MKKLVITLLLALLTVNTVFCVNRLGNIIIQIPLHITNSYYFGNNNTSGNRPSRSPIKEPTIGFDGTATLYLYNQFNELTLNLEENNSIKYSTIIPANTNEVTLPNLGSGTYELKLDDGRYEYSCTLEVD